MPEAEAWFHMAKLGLLSACLLSAGFLTLPGAGTAVPPGVPGDHDATFGEAVAALAGAMRSADTVVLHEGLPHPVRDRERFESEKKAKPSRLLDDQWFYAEARTLAPGDEARLRGLLGSGALAPYGGMKFCGGFHADFAVAWTTGNATTTVLLCFGCGEARIIRTYRPFSMDITSREYRLTADLSPGGCAQLRKMLAPHRRDRPA